MARRMVHAILLIGFGLIAAGSVEVLADGMILPDHPERGWLSVAYHDVTITVRDGVVTTHIDQLFRNPSGHDLEGRYIFPLPPDATVSSFIMWTDGEALEATLLDAEEARTVYEDYVRQAIDPALLEYVGRDALSARVFPIPAGGERRIEITYRELLAAEFGAYRYRYPLDTERFSARPLERVTITVDLFTTSPLRAIYSPSHTLELVRSDEYSARASYSAENLLPTQDFYLYYSVSPDAMGMTLLTYRPAGEDGYFLLIATPPVQSTADAPIAKDLVFVLDTSGSMTGDKIVQAKDALTFILENLNAEDRFAVIAFSDDSQALQPQLVPVSPNNIDDAKRWVSQIEAGGGTNIDDALSEAYALFQPTERPQFLIFLTDGEATVGEVDPLAIAAHARNENTTDARLFAFGVGYNVNTILLDQLAQESRGTTTYVLPEENLEVSISGFYRKIASPVLADLSLDVDGITLFDVYPGDLPDMFRGTQLLILGRYRGQGAAQMTLSGTAGESETAFTSMVDFPASSLSAAFLPRLWASRKISYLLSQIRLYGENEELIDTVIALSRRYGVITPYTSFLVEGDVLSDEDAADAVRQTASAPVSGASAVANSTSLKTLSEAETVQSDVEGVRIVGDRTYFLHDGVWTDSEYSGGQTLDIVVYSDAYFELISLVDWIGPHLALGESIIVRIGTSFLRIGQRGLLEMTDDVAALLRN